MGFSLFFFFFVEISAQIFGCLVFWSFLCCFCAFLHCFPSLAILGMFFSFTFGAQKFKAFCCKFKAFFMLQSGHCKLARQMTLLMAFCDYVGNCIKVLSFLLTLLILSVLILLGHGWFNNELNVSFPK